MVFTADSKCWEGYSFWVRCSWEQIFKIGIFPIPTEVTSGFGIFKENRDTPDEIGMVGHSGLRVRVRIVLRLPSLPIAVLTLTRLFPFSRWRNLRACFTHPALRSNFTRIPCEWIVCYFLRQCYYTSESDLRSCVAKLQRNSRFS